MLPEWQGMLPYAICAFINVIMHLHTIMNEALELHWYANFSNILIVDFNLSPKNNFPL